MSWWKWLLGGLLVGSAFAALVAFFMTRRKEFATLAADAIDAAHGARIRSLQAEVTTLRAQTKVDLDAVKKAEAEVQSRRASIKRIHKAAALSPDEVRARFEKMKV